MDGLLQTFPEVEAGTAGLSAVLRRVCRRANQFRARLPQIQAGMASPEVATTSDPSETKNCRGPRAAYPARRVCQPSTRLGAVHFRRRTVVDEKGDAETDDTFDETGRRSSPVSSV